MNGMKTGAVTGRPWYLATATWPSSCTNSSNTKPSPNCQPQISAYAATETKAEPTTVKSLSLKMAAAPALNFHSSTPTSAIGAQSFLSMSRNGEEGWIGS